jgi:hypothetical protein
MSHGSPFPRACAFIFATILAVNCFAAAAAQSGRRATKPPPAPSAPLPEATPTPAVTSVQPKPVLQFVVGIDRYDSFSSVSIGTYNDVLRSCAQRLDEPSSVSVERVEHPISRSEATNRAKAEKNAYVVLLRVREDQMSSSRTGSPNNVYIEYFVFAPTTAKVVSSGSAYPRKRGIVPSSRPSSIYGDPEVIEAARTVANKILAALQMHVPSRPLSDVD